MTGLLLAPGRRSGRSVPLLLTRFPEQRLELEILIGVPSRNRITPFNCQPPIIWSERACEVIPEGFSRPQRQLVVEVESKVPSVVHGGQPFIRCDIVRI